jgi:hypothetical protein
MIESTTGALRFAAKFAGLLARSQTFIAYRTTAVRLIATWVKATYLNGGAPPL